MSKSILSEREKERAFELYTKDKFSQAKIANLYDVSQGTMSRVIKEMTHKAEIEQLNLEVARREEMMERAMIKGVQAHLEKNSTINIDTLLDTYPRRLDIKD